MAMELQEQQTTQERVRQRESCILSFQIKGNEGNRSKEKSYPGGHSVGSGKYYFSVFEALWRV